jgi:signal transduction histidine kinase
VHGNSTELEQVFINLLINAMDATESGGTITVSARSLDHNIEILIADTGHGIPADTRQRIFDPFFTTKDVGAGTGLGLSISYRIIKDHLGEIEIRETSDKGTTFTVTLPRATEKQEQA